MKGKKEEMREVMEEQEEAKILKLRFHPNNT